MNKNYKSILYSNNKITKTTVDKNFNFNYLYKLLDLKDPNSFCEIEFINYSKKEIMNITSIISNNIKIKINNITSNFNVTKDKEDSIDLEESYEYESIESEDDHHNESLSTFVNIDDKINKLFIYDYENDNEEYIVLCLQPKSNKIVIWVINKNNILYNKDYYDYYAYYGSNDDEYFFCEHIYGYIGRYIEFYAEKYPEEDPEIFIFRSNTKKQIANNIKKLDFIFHSGSLGFIHILESKDLDMFVNSFWHLYFLLGPEHFSYDYFILDELIPNANKDFYMFYQNISFIITSDQEILDYLDIDYTYDYNFNIKIWRDKINPDMPNKNYLLNRLDFIQSKRDEQKGIKKSDEIKIEPLSEEEIIAISQRLEDNNEYDTEIARAIFTILVSGYEYQKLYSLLQAHQSAYKSGLYQLAEECTKIVGIKDTMEKLMMYKEAEAIFGNLPAIAQNILESDPEDTDDE